MPDEPDIVVTGTRVRDDEGNMNWTFVRSTSGTAGVRDITPPQVSEDSPIDQVL